MRTRYRGNGKPVRIVAAVVALAAAGVLTVTFVSGGGKGSADAATSLTDYVPIQRVQPNVVRPAPGPAASRGRFTVDCGTNRIGKFSPDNPVAQPGIRNGAEHLHDFVGNIAITATSSDADLEASGTTCRNGDRSSYFWPVVRIDHSVRDGEAVRQALAATSGAVVCPSVRDRLPAVPAGARTVVDRKLAELDQLTAAAGRRLQASRGADPTLNNEVLGRLRERRAAVLVTIGNAIRGGHLVSLADCDVSYDGIHAGHTAAPSPAPSTAPASPAPSGSALPEPQGRNRELPNNTGGIVRPSSVLIEYRGNATAQVVPMPRLLRALTGDAKPTSRGPANARAAWTCSGFGDRLTDKYPICPAGRQVQRVHDFPGCWDGKNVDSANHRSHVAFADQTTGACPAGFVAIPQLRVTISYRISRAEQLRGQYALDSFPEENHNPFSDHDDFVNVNSTRTMQRIATCLNQGRNCA
ncbi:DUF1996 domain-containing protein [Actinoplanes sp. L3-i22]|uniref:DUF1996 domain-containing protein n=1 Tax=Actinoplanes sp. L3-i22 TaxID=2836373 RepID=UPI001C781520|nr:DUF1996 domain-containing protein [Actinoplanes sp. L3-i22]BCY10199.1 hypothetical protein L3i22_052870 [Actinoplanes sp. L3-i22]